MFSFDPLYFLCCPCVEFLCGVFPVSLYRLPCIHRLSVGIAKKKKDHYRDRTMSQIFWDILRSSEPPTLHRGYAILP